MPRTIRLYAHDVEPSGAPRVTLDVARVLQQAGHEVQLYFPKRGGLEEQALELGVPTGLIPNPPESFRSATWSRKLQLLGCRVRTIITVYSELRKAGKHPVAWVGSSVLPEVALGAWLAGARVVLHVHEDLPITRSNRIKARFFSAICHEFVFVTRRSTRCFRGIVPSSRIHVVPNRVEAQFLNPSGGARPRRSAGAPRMLLFVGFLSHRKGVDLLLKALPAVIREHPVTLQLAGSDPLPGAPFEAELRSLVRELKLEGCVEFLGYRSDTRELLEAADFFVLPSRNESLPLSLVEAMAVGCPAIATDVGGIRDILKSEKTGWLCSPDSVEELSAVLIKALNHPHPELIAQKARRLILRQFQPERIDSALLQLVE
ncbi:MAG: glycosyltransferase family 4 protein [Candidatus Sumerlaeia bacterium]|nr:glycosyltransferase family 4 protein [Candidatus Sumerlaeia bacterium]